MKFTALTLFLTCHYNFTIDIENVTQKKMYILIKLTGQEIKYIYFFSLISFSFKPVCHFTYKIRNQLYEIVFKSKYQYQRPRCAEWYFLKPKRLVGFEDPSSFIRFIRLGFLFELKKSLISRPQYK